jgi:hypothetical protein
MDAHRLRAPASDGELLADPPPERAVALLESNAEKLGRWDHDFQGRTATKLRRMVRVQVLGRAREFLAAAGLDTPPSQASAGSENSRLVVTGHQPELFHPGVWVAFCLGGGRPSGQGTCPEFDRG